MRVKIISALTVEGLEENMNKFFEENCMKIYVESVEYQCFFPNLIAFIRYYPITQF
jgi:hypothetical protein